MSADPVDTQVERLWREHLPETRRRVYRVVLGLRALESGGLVQADRDQARRDAHLVVGMASVYRRPELARLAAEAERALGGLRSADALGVGELVARLERATP